MNWFDTKYYLNFQELAEPLGIATMTVTKALEYQNIENLYVDKLLQLVENGGKKGSEKFLKFLVILQLIWNISVSCIVQAD